VRGGGPVVHGQGLQDVVAVFLRDQRGGASPNGLNERGSVVHARVGIGAGVQQGNGGQQCDGAVTFLLCSRAIPALKATRGAIVNVGSDAGVVGNAGCAVYCRSRPTGGVWEMQRSRPASHPRP
jgi:NAD(P)-dependent dehydrogenase (short-subunit alcohol dehydrogenase family)